MTRLALGFSLALLLTGPAAFAEAPGAEAGNRPELAAAAPDPAAEAEPAPTLERRRLTTVERWRGKPYLRSEDALLRGQALDKALPPVENGFSTNGGLGLQASEDPDRMRALDRAMPVSLNPSFLGGF